MPLYILMPHCGRLEDPYFSSHSQMTTAAPGLGTTSETPLGRNQSTAEAEKDERCTMRSKQHTLGFYGEINPIAFAKCHLPFLAPRCTVNS